LEAQVHELLPMLDDYNMLGADPSYFILAATKLSRSLLAPIEAELSAARHVIISPSGILHYLPFEALLLPISETPERAPDFAALNYLALSADVSYVPSVSTLARLRIHGRGQDGREQAASLAREILLVGNPTPPAGEKPSVFAQLVIGSEMAPLRYADEEMRLLQRLFPDPQSVALRQDDASLSEIKQAIQTHSFRYAHFATHGFLNEKRPQYSGLVLTGNDAQGDDGFMTTNEVFGLELECDQVVLSACASALGENVTGEGLVGLSHGFLYAGARSIVAALWDVSDKATAHFMSDFYGQIAQAEGSERAHALADAKRKMIRGESGFERSDVDTAHPYFWAAFVMIGDGR
jgi:CHAT domain-containing protein